MTPQFFGNIPRTDALSLFEGRKPRAQKIVDFLSLTRTDVAKANKVSLHSVRYDIRMPEPLQEWFRDVGLTVNLVAEFFQDPNKTAIWFATPNPMLGNITPVDMIKMGRLRKLLTFVQTALEDNPPVR